MPEYQLINHLARQASAAALGGKLTHAIAEWTLSSRAEASRRGLTGEPIAPAWPPPRPHNATMTGSPPGCAPAGLRKPRPTHGLPASIIVSTTLKDLQAAAGTARTGGGTTVPMSDVVRLAVPSPRKTAPRRRRRRRIPIAKTTITLQHTAIRGSCTLQPGLRASLGGSAPPGAVSSCRWLRDSPAEPRPPVPAARH
ncbi:hypothetical protein B1T49_18365 [Mycobacterium persicum]|nr:hypothetical protein B1T49_18365 [Mycobacterium persicum]